MNSSDFLLDVQARTARAAVGPSAVRKQGKGCAIVARVYFQNLNLSRFATRKETSFRRLLDNNTLKLQQKLPKNSRSWGLARKLLNIFLRDSLYTIYLHRAYSLNEMEDFLEIPLDSITGKELKRIAGRGRLPAWPGVKNLDKALSDRFQEIAKSESRKLGISRVHLDAKWWARRENA